MNAAARPPSPAGHGNTAAGNTCPQLRALGVQGLDAVLAIEQGAYGHPWTRGNFADALASGYWAQGLWLGPTLIGVPIIVMMAWAMMAYPALLAAQRISRACTLRSSSVARSIFYMSQLQSPAEPIFLSLEMFANSSCARLLACLLNWCRPNKNAGLCFQRPAFG